MATLAAGQQQNLDEEGAVGGIHPEESCVGEPPIAEPPVSLLCSPAKRTSLPDSWKMLPDASNWTSLWTSQEGQSGPCGAGSSGPGLTSTQLHRQLMALRLQRRAGVVESPGNFILCQ